MAKLITEIAREQRLGKIRDVVVAHSASPYRWGRVDCISLVEGVLYALGITPCLRRHAYVRDTHDATVKAAIGGAGSTAEGLAEAFDGIGELERVVSPYDWSPGQIGLTPVNEIFHFNFREVKLDQAWPGIVDHEGKPRILSIDRGVVSVSKLWPRWRARVRRD